MSNGELQIAVEESNDLTRCSWRKILRGTLGNGHEITPLNDKPDVARQSTSNEVARVETKPEETRINLGSWRERCRS